MTGPLWASQNALRGRNVVCERSRRVLNDAHVVPVFLQDLVDVLPTGAIYEAAVDKHDGGFGILRCVRSQDARNSGGEACKD